MPALATWAAALAAAATASIHSGVPSRLLQGGGGYAPTPPALPAGWMAQESMFGNLNTTDGKSYTVLVRGRAARAVDVARTARPHRRARAASP